MTQIELKQQLQTMQNRYIIEDVLFYRGKKYNTIVVVYRYKDGIWSDEYKVIDRRKIQDILNFFDEEDRIEMGGNSVQQQEPMQLT